MRARPRPSGASPQPTGAGEGADSVPVVVHRDRYPPSGQPLGDERLDAGPFAAGQAAAYAGHVYGGAEGEGMDAALAAACDRRLSIPGSGAVESLNVAAATAVFLSRWAARRQA